MEIRLPHCREDLYASREESIAREEWIAKIYTLSPEECSRLARQCPPHPDLREEGAPSTIRNPIRDTTPSTGIREYLDEFSSIWRDPTERNKKLLAKRESNADELQYIHTGPPLWEDAEGPGEAFQF